MVSLYLELAWLEERSGSDGDVNTSVDVDSFKVISSPFNAMDYPANRVFKWSIQVAYPGYVRVTIEFIMLHNKGVSVENYLFLSSRNT